MYADDKPFAQVRMSGWMLKVVEPNMLPVRPKPQMTSSAIIKMSYLRRTAWTFSK